MCSATAPQPRSVIPNVQLSPRSAAFVSQNNDILNRRKVYGSPDRDRSRSPVTPPSRYTPGRWSLSPPPYNNVNLRPNNFEHRSGSRSPAPQILRRSPMANSNSPLLTSIKSRSPLPSKLRKSPLRKSLSRSPHRMVNDRHLSPQYSRNRSPIEKYNHNQKPYRRYSPTQNRPYNRKQQNFKRSQSPRNNGHHRRNEYGSKKYEAEAKNVKTTLDSRSKSPINNSKRSRSKSPNRNFPNRPNRVEHTGLNKRHSPPYSRKSNRVSNRYRRKPTPTNRSPSPANKRKIEELQNATQQSTEDETALPIVENDKIEKTDELTTETKPENEKSIENVDNELSPSSDDDKSSDENEDDGIDLFASEESESETEGRFKSNSSKNVKPNTVATLSFSKLGNATTSTLGDLNEVKTDKISTSSSHRDDRYKRSANYTNRKEDRNRKYGNSRNDDRYGESRNNYKSRYPSSAASVVPKVVDEKKKDDKLMFKSTFQVLANELKSGEITLHFLCSSTRFYDIFL